MFYRIWPALRGRNLRLYLMGQVPSLAGTLMQNAAQSWLVYLISHSAYWIGVNAFLFFLPTTILAPVGGIIVDRWNIRKLVIFTQTAAMAMAFALGIITLHAIPPLWVVNLFAFCLGVVNSIDMPGRYSLIREMVEREHLTSVSGINSALYNISVAVGPAAAGVLIPLMNIGWIFILNGVSFWGVIISLWLIKPQYPSEKCAAHPWIAITEGAKCAASTTFIRSLLLLSCVTLMLGYSFRTILPIVAVQVYHDGPRVFGFLTAAAAFGAFIGATIASAQTISRRIPPYVFLGSGTCFVGASLFAFSFTHTFGWGIAEMALSGFGLLFSYPIIQSELQTHAKENMIGRIMGWSAMMMFGGMMLGGFLNGILAQHFGVQATIRMSAITSLLLAYIIFSKRSSLRAPIAYQR